MHALQVILAVIGLLLFVVIPLAGYIVSRLQAHGWRGGELIGVTVSLIVVAALARVISVLAVPDAVVTVESRGTEATSGVEALHEEVIADLADGLSLDDAAALAGVLQERRVTLRVDASGWARRTLPPLTAGAAVALVAFHSGHDAGGLRARFREEWVRLRAASAPRLVAMLKDHPRVAGVHRDPDVI